MPQTDATATDRDAARAASDARSQKLTFLFAMLVLAFIWFGNLQYRLLSDPDEGRYAEIPREMLVSGDWLAPHLNDIQYLEKPPLQYWATAALYSVFGVKPWVSRLYNTGLGFLLTLLVWRSGSRLFGASAGRLSALVLASGILFYVLAHVNTLDMGLTFWLNAGILALLHWNGSEKQRASLWIGWACLGLAVLQKGLVGVVLPGFALALYVLAQRDWSLIRRLQVVPGLLLVVAINLPWWWLMQRRNPQFVDWFFVHEHYTRFTTTEHGRSEPWWYFSALLFVGVLPWLMPTVRGAVLAWRGDRSAPRDGSLASGRLLLIWAAAVFIFYSPSGSKLAPYILPMMPPLALLAGRHLATVQAPRMGLAGSFVAAGMVAALLLALPTIAGMLTPPPGQGVGYAQIARWGFGGGVLLAMATLQAWVRSRFGVESLPTRRERAVAILSIGMAGAFALLSNGTNAMETWRGAPDITAALRQQLQPDSRLYCVDTYPQTVIFALARTCTTVRDHGELETQFDDNERNHLDTLDEFRAAWQADVRPLAVLDPRAWSELQQQGFAARVLFENPFAVVIARSP